MKKLSVIIPVYNEVNLINKVINKVIESKINKEIIVVDDNSNDGTREILQNIIFKKVDKIVYQNNNLGKGAAIQVALKYVTGDAVIIQDADLEYDPNEYHKLADPIFNNETNVVYGSRYLNKKMRGYFLNRLGNRFFNWFSNKCNKQDLTDANTCYICFNSSLINKLNLKEKGFAFNPEITANFAKLNESIKEVQISYFPRSVKDGKKIRFKDSFRHIKVMWKYRK